MFIMDALKTLFWSYEFYFSSVLFIGFAILIAACRCFQVLYKNKMHKAIYYLMEILVEVFRLFQLIFMVCIGTNTAVRDLFSTVLWDKIFLGTNKIKFPEILWSVLGFLILFLVYNILVHLLFRRSLIKKWMHRYRVNRFPLKSIQLLLIFGFKNLFLIPVSILYILNIIHILG